MNSKILSEKIQNIFEKYKIPSLSVIITNKDQNLYENYLGFKNSKNKTPFDELSIVRIASMTKPITSLCIFQLIEQNLISLETNLQDIDKRFSDVKIIKKTDNKINYIKPKSNIKIKHLLNHTSGYGYQFLNPEIKYLVDNKLLQDLKDDGADFLDAPILFEPGERWNYGIGIDILGYIIEKISNKKLNEYMKENLFNKLGMHNTTFHLDNTKFKDLAYVYNYTQDQIKIDQERADEQENKINKTFHAGGGGLLSTTQDYAKFMRLFLKEHNEIISQESINLIQRNQIGSLEVKRMPSVDAELSASLDYDDNIEKKFGYGFMINNQKTNEGRPKGSIFWTGIFNSFFWIDFENKIGCAIFMQMLPYLNEISLKTYNEIETAIYQNIDTKK